MKRPRVPCISRMHGFTLVELLVVLAILALLAGLAGPKLINSLEGAKPKTAKLQIDKYFQALDVYKLDVGSYPTTEEGLQALVTKPASAKTWNGPYVQGDLPVDPWNHPYKYSNSGEIEITSLGADGTPGGDGVNADITKKN